MDHKVRGSTDSQVAVQALTQALEAKGLRVYRSFDLRSALAVMPDCGCPHHGTDQCSCQYAVLLVYGDTPSPAKVVVHGCDGQTSLSVPEANDAPTNLQGRILDIIADTFSQERARYEGRSKESAARSKASADRSSKCPADGWSPSWSERPSSV